MRGGLGGHTQERRVKNEEDGFPFFMEHTRLGMVERLIFRFRKEMTRLKVIFFNC